MATPVVLVSTNGTPVIEASAGTPVTSVASNATPVTLSYFGGMPVKILDTSDVALNLVVNDAGLYVINDAGEYVVQ